MQKYDVELEYFVGLSVKGVEAVTREEAVEKAQEIAGNLCLEGSSNVVFRSMEYDRTSYVQES